MRKVIKLATFALAVVSANSLSAEMVDGTHGAAIAYDSVLELAGDASADAAPAPAPASPPTIEYSDTLAVSASTPDDGALVAHRAIEPADSGASAASGSGGGLFRGGKLLLTNAVTSIEGTSGGGIATWAVIAGNGMDRGLGASAHFTAVELPDFGLRSFGGAIGIGDRVELSYARHHFDTRTAGALLGLGDGYTFRQDIYAAKVRVAGDIVYGAPLMPQIALGMEYKRNLNAPIVGALGAANRDGIDYTLSATKLFLQHSLLVNATARLTKANQLGILGFGGPDDGYAMQFEGSLAYMLSRRAVVGAEYRSKPDNLGLGEDDWIDLFAALALNDNLTLTAAYVDLGSIATFEDQRGAFLQAQVAF